jgi:hypothetical protein
LYSKSQLQVIHDNTENKSTAGIVDDDRKAAAASNHAAATCTKPKTESAIATEAPIAAVARPPVPVNKTRQQPPRKSAPMAFFDGEDSSTVASSEVELCTDPRPKDKINTGVLKSHLVVGTKVEAFWTADPKAAQVEKGEYKWLPATVVDNKPNLTTVTLQFDDGATAKNYAPRLIRLL